jgi:ABC-2 type transport system ATP-binding protein
MKSGYARTVNGERALPAQASLRYLKVEAKRRHAAGEFPSLHLAQLAIAREHGQPSWTALKEAAAAAAAGWLERLGVADRAGSKVESLSLGNQQRVQLASALAHNPDLLILDEPLSGLDPAGIDAVGEVLASEARAGKCVLFSSHQLDLVEDLCESVVIIDRGRVVTSGTVDELTTAGPPRLVVRVAGDRDGAWARGLAGVTVSENDGGALRLVLAEEGGAGAQSVLRAAMAAGPVTEFAVRRRRLSEVFREAFSQRAGRRPAPAAGAARGAGVSR